MNERIKELIAEAHQYANDNSGGWNTGNWFKAYNKKFAELIVRECATAIEKDLCNRPDDHVSNYFDGGLRHSIRSIKQHFGVEE